MAKKSPAVRRYLGRMLTAACCYVVAVFITIHVLDHGRKILQAALLLAAIPSIPLIGMIVVVALYLKEEKDEFQRELFIQSLLWGMGATLAITSFWSYVHIFSHVPPVDGLHVFVLFWILTGLSTIPLRRYYGGGSGE